MERDIDSKWSAKGNETACVLISFFSMHIRENRNFIRDGLTKDEVKT